MILRVGPLVLLVSCGAPAHSPRAVPQPEFEEAASAEAAPGSEPEPVEVDLVLQTPTPMPVPPVGPMPSPRPPTELYDAWVALRELGFPDVSGLPYHEVVLRDVWSTMAPTSWRTHAWVLAPPDSDGVAFVVWWDGLVYATRTIGPRANVRDDALWMRRACNPYDFANYDSGDFQCPPSNTAAVLLYQLGEMDRADDLRNLDRNWSRLEARAIVTLWARRRFTRLLAAFSSGDDDVAREDLNWLRAAEPLLRQRERSSDGGGFLSDLNEVAIDLERRRTEPAPPIIPDDDYWNPQTPRPPIGVLIDALDEVNAPMIWERSATVRALAAHGAAAIDPLLAVIVHDTRLTRTLDHGRNAFALPDVLPVGDAAVGALELIIDRGVLDAVDRNPRLGARGGPVAFAARVRVAIRRFGHAAAPETWLALLAAPDLDLEVWMHAARRLTARDGHSAASPLLVDERFRQQYEARVNELLDARLRRGVALDAPLAICQLAAASLAWSDPDVRPAVTDAARSCMRPQPRCPCVGDLVAASERVRPGLFLTPYLVWLSSKTSDTHLPDLLAPILAFPAHPEMIASARWLASPQNNFLPRADSPAWFDRMTLAQGLFELEPVRERVVVELANGLAYGTVQRVGESIVFIRWGVGRDEFPDPDVHLLGAYPLTVRVRDVYAWMVSALPFAPGFSLAWPLSRRDAAIEEIRAFVQAYRPAAP